MNNNTTPPSLCAGNRYEYAPLAGKYGLLAVLEALLKQPGRIVWEVSHGRVVSMGAVLALIALFSLAIYGVVVGSLTGGEQLLIAPAKIALGTFLSLLICLPSLYIFLCLGGADVHLRQVAGMLVASACLSALLLISFAPVAWVFSQSTDSAGFMGFLHLLFWMVALIFGLGFLSKGTALVKPSQKGNLTVWIMIYAVVSLQMMTSLRPIIGHSETFLPEQKQFFLAHWADVLSGTESAKAK